MTKSYHTKFPVEQSGGDSRTNNYDKISTDTNKLTPVEVINGFLSNYLSVQANCLILNLAMQVT